MTAAINGRTRSAGRLALTSSTGRHARPAHERRRHAHGTRTPGRRGCASGELRRWGSGTEGSSSRIEPSLVDGRPARPARSAREVTWLDPDRGAAGRMRGLYAERLDGTGVSFGVPEGLRTGPLEHLPELDRYRCGPAARRRARGKAGARPRRPRPRGRAGSSSRGRSADRSLGAGRAIPWFRQRMRRTHAAGRLCRRSPKVQALPTPQRQRPGAILTQGQPPRHADLRTRRIADRRRPGVRRARNAPDPPTRSPPIWLCRTCPAQLRPGTPAPGVRDGPDGLASWEVPEPEAHQTCARVRVRSGTSSGPI